jgi:hypothetical protein
MGQIHTLTVSTCRLDAGCRATLTTMLNNGWTKAHTPYTTTQNVLSLAELGHLLQHGGLPLQSGPISTLQSYSSPRFGPGAGTDVSFQLNVDLV